MKYKKVDNMKNILLILFILLSTNLYSQDWVGDKDYDQKIHEKSAFGDDEVSIVVIEFWAKFNDVNAFQEFKQLKNVTHYYRCDISTNPELKKKYRVRMAPTILIFVNGVLEEDFRAGLDLECPVDLLELQEAIEEARLSSQF